MVILSSDQIEAIAAEVVKQLRPILAPAAVSGKEPAEVEIARVRAAGIDTFAYLKERAAQARKRGK